MQEKGVVATIRWGKTPREQEFAESFGKSVPPVEKEREKGARRNAAGGENQLQTRIHAGDRREKPTKNSSRGQGGRARFEDELPSIQKRRYLFLRRSQFKVNDAKKKNLPELKKGE